MSEQTNEQQLDRKDLKILAYKERVAELNEQVADLRVEVTFLAQQLQEAQRPQVQEDVADASSEED